MAEPVKRFRVEVTLVSRATIEIVCGTDAEAVRVAEQASLNDWTDIYGLLISDPQVEELPIP